MTKNITIPDFAKEVLTHPSLDDCQDDECVICGYRDCPYHEPLHYHHDGCPACMNKEIEKIKKSLSDKREEIHLGKYTWVYFEKDVKEAIKDIKKILGSRGFLGGSLEFEIDEVLGKRLVK